MSIFSRADNSVFGRWWWTVDRWSLAALAILIGIGIVLILAASPPVATRLNLDDFYFVKRHLNMVPVAVALIFGISMMSPTHIKRFAVIAFLGVCFLLVMTLAVGNEINGAKRWIYVVGFSLQPSEFIKPLFAVVTAWLLSEQCRDPKFPGRKIAVASLLAVLAIVVLQPDLGQAFVLTAVWLAQLFLAGLSISLVLVLLVLGVIGLVGAYLTMPHVTSRVDRFLDPSSGDTYQVRRSLEAFSNGGLAGRGPGEGQVKNVLPDAHSDFIFAVAGEELGILAALALVAIFAFIVLRGFSRALQDQNLFVILATAGLFAQFGVQALINMASTLNMMPTKGMTLPFISYGGSSLTALALGMGMALALTRRRPGERPEQ
ncbi:MAG: putative lipid II flippase FtsW [Alphaproteobacteria bacterium]|nr:putative lipid II flippase FtsW [Alphaproteobacteria bacterium]